MFAKLRAARESEKGFTLVELLVVIIIIGILAAVAIPAFLNQRQRANDAAVQSDIKNVATQIETALVESPNAATVAVATTLVAGVGTATLTIAGAATTTTILTSGVQIGTKATGSANGYILFGAHTNGKQFRTTTAVTAAPNATDKVLVFNSASGGIQAGAVAYSTLA